MRTDREKLFGIVMDVLPGTDDVPPETADNMPETSDELPSTADELPGMGEAPAGRASKGGNPPVCARNGAYLKQALKGLFPYLLALLVLLAVTQAAAGILWHGQAVRLEGMYHINGAEYVQE